jgi:hypothetical protein
MFAHSRQITEIDEEVLDQSTGPELSWRRALRSRWLHIMNTLWLDPGSSFAGEQGANIRQQNE